MIWIPILALVLLFAYEIYALRTVKKGDTISEWVWAASAKSRLLPFALGLLMGHFVW